MKKENFITLIIGTVGGVLFALGMCMCLVTEWNAFQEGVIVGIVGTVILFIMLIVRRKMQGKPHVSITKKTAGIVALGIAGALTLGVGMCMTMVWEGLLVWGIIIGILGILLLLCLIPVCKGLK